MAPNYRSPMYLVQVNYGGADSSYSITHFGSFHGIFSPMLGCKNADPLYDFSESGYQDMATQFHDYLRHFLYGDASGHEMSVDWPAWTPETPTTLILDAHDGHAAITTADVFSTPAHVIDALGADSSLTSADKDAVIRHVLSGRWFSTELDEHYGTPQAVHLLA